MAFYFGSALQKHLKVPIGILRASHVGGAAEIKMPKNALLSFPAGRKHYEEAMKRSSPEATTEGAASLVITREKCYLATNNIEAPRLHAEEGLTEQGWEFIISPWTTPLKGLNELITGKTVLSDVPFGAAQDVSAEISRLRAHLTPEEGQRFRELGRLCAESITAAAQALQPGLTEYKIAALIDGEAQRRGVQPIVTLVATDDRAYRYRHPLPTEKKLEKYALLVLCGRQHGLVRALAAVNVPPRLPKVSGRSHSWGAARALVKLIFLERNHCIYTFLL